MILVPSSCLRSPKGGRLIRILVFALPNPFDDDCRSLQGRSNGQTVQKWSLPEYADIWQHDSAERSRLTRG